MRSGPVGTVARMSTTETTSEGAKPRLPLVISTICGLLIILSVFLPWVQFTGIVASSGIDTKRQGIETSDGKFILVLAVIGLVALFLARGHRWGSIVQLVVAVIIAVIGFADIANPVSTEGRFAELVKENTDVLAGLWLIAFAGIIWAIMAIVDMARPSSPPTPAAPPPAEIPPME